MFLFCTGVRRRCFFRSAEERRGKPTRFPAPDGAGQPEKDKIQKDGEDDAESDAPAVSYTRQRQ